MNSSENFLLDFSKNSLFPKWLSRRRKCLNLMFPFKINYWHYWSILLNISTRKKWLKTFPHSESYDVLQILQMPFQGSIRLLTYKCWQYWIPPEGILLSWCLIPFSNSEDDSKSKNGFLKAFFIWGISVILPCPFNFYKNYGESKFLILSSYCRIIIPSLSIQFFTTVTPIQYLCIFKLNKHFLNAFHCSILQKKSMQL